MKLIALFNQNELNKEVNLFLEDWNNPSPFITIKTSGSTGKAKNIVVEKAKMIISARKTLEYFQISKKSDVLLCLSPETIGGKMMIVRSIIGDLNLYIGKLNANPLEEISHIFDFCAMVPMQIINTLKKHPSKIENIKKLIVGGAPLPIKIEEEFKVFTTELFHTFGMTETFSHIAIRKIGIDEPNVYNALNGVSFSTNNDLLIINYPEIMDFPLETKEIVRLFSDKKFEWLGRSDFTINSGGIKIIPENIENKISSIIKKPFFISGIKDDYLGQKVIIVIESYENIELKKDDFKGILDLYEVPKEFFVLQNFKRTNSDKINRSETIKLIKDAGIKIL